MTMLYAAAAVFLALHLGVAGTRLRDVIVGAIGERAYLAAFSLASLAGIIWLAVSYNAASRGVNEILWDLGPAVADLGVIVIAFAFLLGVPGLMTPSPTIVGGEGTARKTDLVKGVLKITRHPFLWSVALWAAFHLAANGDLPSVVLFGAFLILSVAGTFSIDAKRARKMGEAWRGFAQATSNVPFAAVIAGRNSLTLREFVTYREAVAVAAFGAVLFAHTWLFGASPFPGGAAP